jgi:hypothetical protein
MPQTGPAHCGAFCFDGGLVNFPPAGKDGPSSRPAVSVAPRQTISPLRSSYRLRASGAVRSFHRANPTSNSYRHLLLCHSVLRGGARRAIRSLASCLISVRALSRSARGGSRPCPTPLKPQRKRKSPGRGGLPGLQGKPPLRVGGRYEQGGSRKQTNRSINCSPSGCGLPSRLRSGEPPELSPRPVSIRCATGRGTNIQQDTCPLQGHPIAIQEDPSRIANAATPSAFRSKPATIHIRRGSWKAQQTTLTLA